MIKDCILSEKILKLLNKDNKYKSPDAIALYSGLNSLFFFNVDNIYLNWHRVYSSKGY